MKSIVCYGDSNTWGYDGGTGERFPYEQRWTTLLQRSLGNEYSVIPEGLCGRTTAFDDPFEPFRNGLKALPYCLHTHKPIDLIVFMLGTNDVKVFFNPSVLAVGMGMRALVEAVRGGGFGPGGTDPRILITAPAPVEAGNPAQAPFDIRQFASGEEISRKLAEEYALAADEYGCEFADAGLIARVCLEDGVHLTAEAHRELAELMKNKIRSIFS